MRQVLYTASFILLAGTALAQQFTPPSTSLAQTPSGLYTLDKSHANIVFGVSHLGFSQYFGRFNAFDATLQFDAKHPEKSKLEVIVDTTSGDSNNEKMNAKYDGEKFFHTAKFPTATFTSTRIEKLSDARGKITGDLTLLGVTKPVTLDVTFNGAGMNPFAGKHTLGFSATGRIKRSEFGMKEYLPAVGDEVNLMIEAEFNHADSKKN
jgi:polyisoprenoid-binding protein YceI